MIDRDARDELIVLVKDFISGRITNFQFEAGVPFSGDKAIDAIEDYFWSFYDDFKEHHISFTDIPLTTKKEIARLILFLSSDREYRWDEPRNSLRSFRWIFKRPKALRAQKFKKFELHNRGDMSVWPFMQRRHMMTEAGKKRVGLSLKIAA